MHKRFIFLLVLLFVLYSFGAFFLRATSDIPDLVQDDAFKINASDVFLFGLYWKQKQSPTADFNQDLTTDLFDLLTLIDNVGKTFPTYTPTLTPTEIPTATDTPPPTETPTSTPTFTMSPTFTATSTPSPTFTRTPGRTPIATTPTATVRPTESGVSTPTPNQATPTPDMGVTPSPTHAVPEGTPTISQPEFVRMWTLHHYLSLFSADAVLLPNNLQMTANDAGYAVYTHTVANEPRFISFDRFGRIFNRTLPISMEDYGRLSLVDGSQHFGKFFESPVDTFRFRFEQFDFDNPVGSPQIIDHLEADAMMWTYKGSDWGTAMVVMRYPDIVTVHRIAPDGTYLGNTNLVDPNLTVTPQFLRVVYSGDTIGVFYSTKDKGLQSEITVWFLSQDGSLLREAPLFINSSLYPIGIAADDKGKFVFLGRNDLLPYLLFHRLSANGVELQKPFILSNPLNIIWHDDLYWFLNGDNHTLVGFNDEATVRSGPVDIFPPGWKENLSWLNIKKSGPDLGAFFAGPDEESVYYMQIEAGEMVTPTPLPASGNPTGATLDIEISPEIALEMVQVPKGTFIMGSSENEVGHRSDEQPQHQVTLTQDFYISNYEISVKQYKLFKPDHTINPINTLILDEDDYPVTSVSWEEATQYCEWLSSRSEYIFSLPTEAEWEYACRAGSTARRYWGNDADNTAAIAFANIADASYASMFGTEFTTPFPGDDGAIGPANVGSYTANAFGLHDMLGNVWEWCADRYGPYEDSAQTNPTGPTSGNSRVFRGGSWQEGINGDKIRSAVRSALTPTSRDHRIGFRVVIREQDE